MTSLLPAGSLVSCGAAAAAAVPADRLVLLYFASQWCPNARAFLPDFLAFYEAHKSQVEVVVVSSDFSAAEFREHSAPLPWLAVPYDLPLRTALKEGFRVWARKEQTSFDHIGERLDGIPTVIAVSPTGVELARFGDIASLRGADLSDLKSRA